MGMKIIKISPSRGFSAELGTAIVIVVGSYIGFPLSTTQCIVGAIVGVGLVEGAKGINLRFVIKAFLGWIFTFVMNAILAAGIYAWCIGAPNYHQGGLIKSYNNYLTNDAFTVVNATWREFNATNSLSDRASVQALDPLNACIYNALNQTLRGIRGLRVPVDHDVYTIIRLYEQY